MSNIVFINGYTKQDRWEVTGMDWSTGETVHRTISDRTISARQTSAAGESKLNADIEFRPTLTHLGSRATYFAVMQYNVLAACRT